MAIQDIKNYLEANKNQYPLEVLLDNLRKSGYPEAEIQAAIQSMSGSIPPAPPAFAPQSRGAKAGNWLLGFIAGVGSTLLATLAAWYILGQIFSVTFLWYSRTFYLYLAIVVLAGISVPLGLYFWWRGKNRYFAQGILVGLTTVGVPLLALFSFVTIIFG